MIAKTNRFHGRKAITRVYQKGKAVRGQFCAARYINNRHETYRAAVVVSKKVAKTAPSRNRIRRRIYEIIRHQAPTILTNQDVVITVFDERLATTPNNELEAIITKLLKQVEH